MSLQIGDKAPAFSLTDENSVVHNIPDPNGNWTIIYFYPKDNTPGCTTEACGIRDMYSTFAEAKILVFGISADSEQSHRSFKQKFDLPFTLLSDKNKIVLPLYEADKIGSKRKTYIISPDGVIAKIYDKVSPATHAGELIRDVLELKKGK